MPDHPRVPHDARVEAGYPGPQLTGIRSTDVRMAIPGPAPVHVHVRDRQVPGLTLDAGTGRTELTRQGPRAPGSGRVSPPPRGSLRAGLRRPRGPAEAVPSSPPWRSASAFPFCTCDRDEPGDRDHHFARGSPPAGGSREAPSPVRNRRCRDRVFRRQAHHATAERTPARGFVLRLAGVTAHLLVSTTGLCARSPRSSKP